MDNDLYNHVNNATYYSFIDTAVIVVSRAALERDLAHDPIVYLRGRERLHLFLPDRFSRSRSRAACA